MNKIAFIGAGHITEIILNNLARNNYFAHCENILVSDPSSMRCCELSQKFGTAIALDNRTAFIDAAVIFVCTPPPAVGSVVADLADCDPAGKVVVTIAAGVPISALEKIHPNLAVVRTLPNPPSQVGYGILPVACNHNVDGKMRNAVMGILRNLGEYIEMDEDGINIVTSLSSPAPVFAFLESMVEAGVLCGLPREKAVKVAEHTVMGCLKIRENRPEATFADLIAEASTPAGTSVESLYVLDRYAFKAAIKEAYLAAANKARATSESYRQSNCRLAFGEKQVTG